MLLPIQISYAASTWPKVLVRYAPIAKLAAGPLWRAAGAPRTFERSMSPSTAVCFRVYVLCPPATCACARALLHDNVMQLCVCARVQEDAGVRVGYGCVCMFQVFCRTGQHSGPGFRLKSLTGWRPRCPSALGLLSPPDRDSESESRPRGNLNLVTVATTDIRVIIECGSES